MDFKEIDKNLHPHSSIPNDRPVIPNLFLFQDFFMKWDVVQRANMYRGSEKKLFSFQRQ